MLEWLCIWVQCPPRPEEGSSAPGTGVTGAFELPCECWERNMGPLRRPDRFLNHCTIRPAPELTLNRACYSFTCSMWRRGVRSELGSCSESQAPWADTCSIHGSRQTLPSVSQPLTAGPLVVPFFPLLFPVYVVTRHFARPTRQLFWSILEKQSGYLRYSCALTYHRRPCYMQSDMGDGGRGSPPL